MGFRVFAAFSLLIFVHLINLASSNPTKNILPSVALWSQRYKKFDVAVQIAIRDLFHDSLDDRIRKSKLGDKEIYASKMEGGGVHGGGGHGGQSHGGGAVIPVYAAGAANKNHQPPSHHGAADSNLSKIKISSMLMLIFVYPLILIFLLT